MKIKVMLVDDHPCVREGLRAFLERRGYFEITGEAASGAEAVLRAQQADPDVILLDTVMPEMNGLEAAPLLRQHCPRARVLFLTDHERKEYVREIVQSGARGFVSKSAGPEEIIGAIERVYRGETSFRADVAQAFFEDYVLNGGRVAEAGRARLTRREQQVLDLLVDGLGNKEVAGQLVLSVRTVEKHRQRIMRKLGARKATELVKFAATHDAWAPGGISPASKPVAPFPWLPQMGGAGSAIPRPGAR